jgi:hypothetical protein
MQCDKCHNEIGKDTCPPSHQKAYQVRVGYVIDEENKPFGEFIAEEDVGYYCSECLKDGV